MSTFKDEHLTRQMDIIPSSILNEPITIVGAGAIGSWTCLALAKMGFEKITVFDHDKVDTVNLNSQFYRLSDVGSSKVGALRHMVMTFTGTEISAQGTKYEGGKFPGIVIAAVDSMAVRKLIWDQHRLSPATRAIIDPRMGAESALLFVMKPTNPKDQADYAKSLYEDDAALQERCTAKATIYTANLLSGLVCKAVKDLLVQPDRYLRTAMWDIGRNDCELFSSTP